MFCFSFLNLTSISWILQSKLAAAISFSVLIDSCSDCSSQQHSNFDFGLLQLPHLGYYVQSPYHRRPSITHSILPYLLLLDLLEVISNRLTYILPRQKHEPLLLYYSFDSFFCLSFSCLMFLSSTPSALNLEKIFVIQLQITCLHDGIPDQHFCLFPLTLARAAATRAGYLIPSLADFDTMHWTTGINSTLCLTFRSLRIESLLLERVILLPLI